MTKTNPKIWRDAPDLGGPGGAEPGDSPSGPGARLGSRDRPKVWDAPVRMVHWALVGLIGAAWWTADHDQLDAHRLIGAVLAGLIAFRLIWGFVGSRTARFSEFVRGPTAVFRYGRDLLRGPTHAGPPGHNPMGGWSVAALLLLMGVEVGLGLFSVDVDGESSGPLAGHVSFETGRFAAKLHHQGFNILLGLIALHLAAVGFYVVVRKDNLVGPMITGRRKAPGLDNTPAPFWRLALAVSAGVAVTLLLALNMSKGL